MRIEECVNSFKLLQVYLPIKDSLLGCEMVKQKDSISAILKERLMERLMEWLMMEWLMETDLDL